jgi:hypothetical protein
MKKTEKFTPNIFAMIQKYQRDMEEQEEENAILRDRIALLEAERELHISTLQKFKAEAGREWKTVSNALIISAIGSDFEKYKSELGLSRHECQAANIRLNSENYRSTKEVKTIENKYRGISSVHLMIVVSFIPFSENQRKTGFSFLLYFLYLI